MNETEKPIVSRLEILTPHGWRMIASVNSWNTHSKYWLLDFREALAAIGLTVAVTIQNP